jgi:hypothetical protein
MIDITSSERWMHGGESPAFTTPSRFTRWISIDRDTRGADGVRIVRMQFAEPYMGRGVATVSMDSQGKLSKVTIAPQPRGVPQFSLFTAHQDQLNRLLDGDDQTAVALPASRVWDVFPTRAPSRAATGHSWRDTLDLHSSIGLFVQRLSGVRVNTFVGDTLVRGQHYSIVRDSAFVRYYERAENEARTLDTFVVIERRATGTIVGRYLLDAAAGVYHIRDDTTRLAGNATLKFPDGRSFHTPAMFERVRHFAHYSTAAYDSVVADRSSRQQQFSIIARPEGIAERVTAGDTRVEDSLLAAHAASRDAEQRQQIELLVERWSRKKSVRHAMQAQAFAGGDSALGFREVLERMRRADYPVDTGTMRLLLKLLSDPGYAFALGIPTDAYYEHLNDALLKVPPSVMTDTSNWPCTPDACRMLAAQWPSALEPRVRALALVTRFALDPVSMCDSVFSENLHVPMMTGVQTLAIAASDRRCGPVAGVLPRRNASWRAWDRWRQLSRHWVYNPRVRSGDARLRSDSLTLFRMAERISGRDLANEWRTSFARQHTDSAQEVLGSLLAVLGVVAESNDQIADRIESASPSRRALGIREMLTLFASSAHPADSALAEDVIGTLLAVSLDGGRSWPVLHAATTRESALSSPHRVVQALDGAYGPEEKPISQPIILFRNGVPPGVLAAMKRRGVQLVDSGFVLPSQQSALELTIAAPAAVGRFLKIQLTHYHEGARINGRGQSWASGSTYYLLQTNDGWRIVSAGSWIT